MKNISYLREQISQKKQNILNLNQNIENLINEQNSEKLQQWRTGYEQAVQTNEELQKEIKKYTSLISDINEHNSKLKEQNEVLREENENILKELDSVRASSTQYFENKDNQNLIDASFKSQDPQPKALLKNEITSLKDQFERLSTQKIELQSQLESSSFAGESYSSRQVESLKSQENEDHFNELIPQIQKEDPPKFSFDIPPSTVKTDGLEEILAEKSDSSFFFDPNSDSLKEIIDEIYENDPESQKEFLSARKPLPFLIKSLEHSEKQRKELLRQIGNDDKFLEMIYQRNKVIEKQNEEIETFKQLLKNLQDEKVDALNQVSELQKENSLILQDIQTLQVQNTPKK